MVVWLGLLLGVPKKVLHWRVWVGCECEVWGVGFRGQGLGFKVWGSGFKVWGLGLVSRSFI